MYVCTRVDLAFLGCLRVCVWYIQVFVFSTRLCALLFYARLMSSVTSTAIPFMKILNHPWLIRVHL